MAAASARQLWVDLAMSHHVTITAIIILVLVWLAAISLILRLVLFILGKSDRGRLARIDSIAGSVGFLPLLALQWACNLAVGFVLILILAYWIAPQTVTEMLKEGRQSVSQDGDATRR
jgi:multisubunit Na+/H+ antiporter MnhF subunit